jgi:hypothetical protein
VAEWVPGIGGRALLDNNLFGGGSAHGGNVGLTWHYRESGGAIPRDVAIRFTRNTGIGVPFWFFLDSERMPDSGAARAFRIEAADNIFDTTAEFLRFHQSQAMFPPKTARPLPAPEAKVLLGRLLDWHEQRNVWPQDKQRFVRAFVHAWLAPQEGKDPQLDTKSLGDWHDLLPPDVDSLRGAIRYQGGDLRAKLAAAPETVTPSDYRLLENSVGYQAGKDKRHLGADVDLVGPSPAYERWKKTPAYQQWLKDAGLIPGER